MQRMCFLLIAAFAACNSSESPAPVPARDQSVAGRTAQVTREGEAPDRAATLRFARSLADARAGLFASSFQLLAQRDIVTKIELPAESLSSEVSFLHFQLLNPSGVLQQSKWYALSTAENPPATARHPHFATEMPVERVEVRAGIASFYGKIPIAGTSFTRYRLTGTLSATLHLGLDDAEPLLSTSFEMQP